MLVLSAAIRPRPESKKLAEAMRLPSDEDGFFLEAHLKLRPLDFATAGFYLCGLAQGPKFASESIAQARGRFHERSRFFPKKRLSRKA